MNHIVDEANGGDVVGSGGRGGVAKVGVAMEEREGGGGGKVQGGHQAADSGLVVVVSALVAVE